MDDGPEHPDLLITGARLLDGRVVDLVVTDGRYHSISAVGESSRPAAPRVIDADGGLVTPTFINPHLHLDKVFTLPMAGERALQAYTRADMADALPAIVTDARAVKQQYDRTWIEPNVRGVLRQAVQFGVSHLQAFVDVDTTAGLVGFEAVTAVREEFRGLVDVQVVAFPQDGVLRSGRGRVV